MTTTISALVKPLYAYRPDFGLTLGPEVAEVNTLAGFAPDPEQEFALDALFALDKRGKARFFEGCIICCRQNLKTGLIKQAELGWLYVTKQRLVVHSAHEMSTTKEAFLDLVTLIENTPALSKRLAPGPSHGIYRGNGDEAIALASGQRIKFKARTNGGGRGLSGDKVVLDEGFALKPEHMGSLLPTLSARPDPQVLIASSAGLANSAVLRGMRDRGRAGVSPKQLYLEWGAPEIECGEKDCDHTLGSIHCAADDEELWQQANPALGRRITYDYVRDERQSLGGSPETAKEFMRERLGWWDTPDELVEIFGEGRWSGCGVEHGKSSIKGSPTFGLAVSIERSHYCIGAAGKNKRDRWHLEPIEHGRYKSSAVVKRAKKLHKKHGGSFVVDGKSPAAALIPELEAEGVPVIVASTSDYLDACAQIYDDVQEQQVVHMHYPELDGAVAGAKWRDVGDRKAFGRKTEIDITPLEAVTLAKWGAEQEADYDPLDSVL